MKKLGLLYGLLILHFLPFGLFADEKPKGFVVDGDIFGTRNFIENKGQFSSPVKNKEILFLYEHGGEKIYFTKTGLIYEVRDRKPFDQREEEEREREEKEGREAKRDESEERHESEKVKYITAEWLNASPSVIVEPADKQKHYFTYGTTNMNSSAYKKIIYKNVYPFIDVVYEIPLDKTNGIKYSLLLHPGCDPSQIAWHYSGKIKRTFFTKNGDLKLVTPYDTITEHAPSTYYSNGTVILLNLEINNQTITFKFGGPVDLQQEIIIDPWVTSITTSISTVGYDVDHDLAGNVFVYGSLSPHKVTKYSNSGALLWTFGGVIVTPSWNTGTLNSPTGILCDPPSGKIYISRYGGPTTNNEVRLDANGNYDNWLATNSASLIEGGDMEFDCNGDLLVFGGWNASGKIVSVPSATTIIQSFFTGLTGCCQDIVGHAIDPFGNIFVLFGSGGLSNSLANKLCAVAPSFTTNLWINATGFTTFGEIGNRNFLPVGSVNSTEFKSLAVNGNYLFYYDGLNLAVYDKITGLVVATTTVTNGVSKGRSGIAVDNCNNIYVAGNANIHCFSFNGTSFSTLTAIPVGYYQNSEYVYDLQLDRVTNILYATGSGFVSTYTAPYSATCTVNYCSCFQPLISFKTTSTSCVNISASTVNVIGVPGPFTYSWSPSTLTGSAVTGLTPGTHTVSITSLSCNSVYTAATTFTSPLNAYSLSVNSTSITCANLGSATVAATNLQPPFSYTWSPTAQTGSTATGLAPGVYTLTVYSGGCLTTFTTTVQFTSLIPLTGNVVTDNSVTCYGASTGTGYVTNLAGGSGQEFYNWTNGTLTYTSQTTNSLSSGVWSITVTDKLTGCEVKQSFYISQPLQMNLQISSSSPTACVNTNIVLTGTNSGGTPGYNYNWVGGPAASQRTVSQTTAGTYTYFINSLDANSCPMSNSITVNFIARPVLTVTSVSICPLAYGTLSVSGASTYQWNNLQNGSTMVDNPLSNTQYTVVGSALSCTNSATGNISLYTSPVPFFSSNSPVCNGSSLIFNAGGGSTYLWNGPLSFTSTLSSPTIQPANPSQSGNYQFTVTSVEGCTAAAALNLSVHPSPTVSASGSTVCTSQTLVLNSNSVPGATFFWQGPMNYNSFAQNPTINNPVTGRTGNYSVTATSAQGCTVTTITQALVIPPPPVQVAIPVNTLCAEPSNGSQITLTVIPAGALTYTLFTPAYFSNTAPSNTPMLISSTGFYQNKISVFTASLHGSNGICIDSTTFTFSVIPNPTINLNSLSGDICAGQNFSFTASGASYYTWNTGAPDLLTSNNGALAVTNSTNSNVFTAYGSSLSCNSAARQVTLTVQALPTILLGPKQATICLHEKVQLDATGTSTAFVWSPLTGLSNGVGAQVMASPLSTQQYTVTGSIKNCTTSAVITVTVFPLPVPSIVTDKTIYCEDDEIVLKGNGGKTFQWTGPNNFASGKQTVNLRAGALAPTGEYMLTVFDERQCKEDTSIQLTVKPLPQGSLLGFKPEGCTPFCNDYKFSGNFSTIANWQINKQSFGQAFSYCYYEPGEYTIKGFFKDTITGCAQTFTYLVTAYPKPDADYKFEPNDPVEKQNEVTFTSTSQGENINQWNWYIDGFDKTIVKKGEIQYQLFPEAGDYAVALVVSTDKNCIDTVVKNIHVEPDFLFYVPNVFTPNGDGLNDKFLPVTRGVKVFSLEVYDRWGERIFYSKDLATGWDGTFHDVAVKMDVYMWKVLITCNNGDRKEYTGHVSLVR